MIIYRPDWALCIVRLALGSTFILHGGQKVFGWLGGSGLHGWINYVGDMGVPAWLGYLSAIFEFFGGVMVLMGIAAEIGAAMILCSMLGALYLVHWGHGYFLPKGMEYVLNLSLLCLAIIVGGAGSYALWDIRKLF